jgi:hypothetical protein
LNGNGEPESKFTRHTISELKDLSYCGVLSADLTKKLPFSSTEGEDTIGFKVKTAPEVK